MIGINVFIEGPNGSGKSMLADYVKNLLKYDQLNLGHRDGDQFVRYLLEYGRQRTVFCRAHWSEAVYSELFKREQPFTDNEYLTLDSAARLRGITVLCLPRSADVLRDRYLARQTLKGMAQVTIEKYEQLDQEWELWRVCLASDFPRKAANVIYTSIDHADLLDTAQKIASLVKQREESLARR